MFFCTATTTFISIDHIKPSALRMYRKIPKIPTIEDEIVRFKIIVLRSRRNFIINT